MDAEDRKIVKKDDGWHVYSEDGSKHLGGPYKSEGEAKKRLEEVEYFKKKGENSLIFAPERRILPVFEAEIRVKKADDGSRHIVGYAAKFGKTSQNLGGFREIVHPKAFDNALKTADVRGLKNHSPHHLLGRTKSGTMELHVDDVGLRYDIAVPETTIGRDTVAEIERGDLDGSSFAFAVNKDGDEWDDSSGVPTRTLMNIRDLFDVGPVTYPAYLDTEVSCRSFDQFTESRRHAEAVARQAEADAETARKHVLYRQRLEGLRLAFPSFAIPKG